MPWAAFNAFSRRAADLPSGGAALSAAADEIPLYYALRWPVTLVTDARGREDFADSRALFARLVALGREPRDILQVTEAGVSLTPESLVTLNYFLRQSGCMTKMQRVARHRRGPERANWTKWQWEFVTEFLQLTWRASDAG